MKKFFLIILILMFASSASATVYKWVDGKGVTNFTDDYSRVPPDYRNQVEEVSVTKMGQSTSPQAPPGAINAGPQSGKTGTQSPPIAQPLVREGDFAVKLAEALKIGRAESEAEAETLLASVGIAPQNGWIADYPVTPDIIGELEIAIGKAAEARKLPMGKNEALRVFRTIALEHELPIIAEAPDRYSDRYIESPPPMAPQYPGPQMAPQYPEPLVVNNYYYIEGPPVVTYYPPPPDYNYLYDWTPSPFWYSGFYFSGYYILHDFHRPAYVNGHACAITNHIRDHRTGKIHTVHHGGRHEGRPPGGGSAPHKSGFHSEEAKNGARAIFERSHERVALGNTTAPIKERGLSNRNPFTSRPGRGTEKQVYNRESNPSDFNGRNSGYGRPPVADRRMSQTPNETSSHGNSDRTFRRPDSMNRRSGMNIQRPPEGETRSFSPPAQGSERSFSSPPKSGSQHLSSFPMRSRGFYGTHQVSNVESLGPPARGSERSLSSPQQAGGQHSNSSPIGSRSSSGSPRRDRGSGLRPGGPHL